MAEETKGRDVPKMAKKLVEEGIDVLRAGFLSAGVVAGKTVQATKLHYESRRAQIDLYRSLHDVGLAVYEQLKSSGGKTVTVTTDLGNLYRRARELAEKIATAEADLAKQTVVKRPSSEKESPPPAT